MAILLNGAGVSAADPILKGLPCKVIFGASSFDVATVVDEWIETTPTIPGVSGSVKASTSPASTVLTAGIGTGSYNDTTKEYTIASTTGLTVGDRLYLSHGSLTPGFYEILTIPSSGKVTIVGNPLNGANQTGISYQVAWSYLGNTGSAPISSSGLGQINYAKARFQDGSALNGDLAEQFYVEDAPVGNGFVSIGGQPYTGGIVNTLTPAFALLSAWANKGGVSHVELVNHSVQAANQFKWGDGTTAEKTLSAALASGFSLTAGDGQKYGRILLKTKSGGSALGLDIQTLLDTTGPTVVIALVGA
jgi:hypothetical protein